MLIVGGYLNAPVQIGDQNQTDYQMYDELHFSSNYPSLLCVNQLSEFCIPDNSGQWSLGNTLGLHLLFPLRNIQGLTHAAKLMGRRQRCTDDFLVDLIRYFQKYLAVVQGRNKGGRMRFDV